MNENISHEDVLSAPGISMFMTFLITLMTDGKATHSPKSNKVVLLNSDASNYFTMGRDKDNKPYIGLQESMVPWFLDVPWDEVILSAHEKYLYLVAKSEGEPILVLGLKPRKKRMLAINVPDFEKPEDTKVSFRLYKIIDKEIAVSKEKAQKKELSIRWEKTIFDVIKSEEISKDQPKQENLDGFTFINRRNKNGK